ncbi:hypothetical protein WA026_016956 [Henosepilachna vigintioctopunctata]|uniref:Uncharacterized protein n=1 Tax=Henosepilachna vigintioctopunctata TaxID=420089 RepID=A0AAW1U9F4_9CUCU
MTSRTGKITDKIEFRPLKCHGNERHENPPTYTHSILLPQSGLKSGGCIHEIANLLEPETSKRHPFHQNNIAPHLNANNPAYVAGE